MKYSEINWGIAPIGWRNDDLPELGQHCTLGQILSDISVAGFRGTEAGSFFPDAEILKKELRLRGLEVAAKWFSSYIIRDGIDEVLSAFHDHCEYLRKIGASIAVVSEQTYSLQGTKKNVFADPPFLMEKEWGRLTMGLNQLGKVAKKYDLKLAYHHHMGTVIQNLAQINHLMEMTDPENVFLLYDTGHIFVAEGDCTTLLNQHIQRIVHVHFKDVRKRNMILSQQYGHSFSEAFLNGLFTVPGDGTINFIKIYQTLLKEGYRGWIIIEAEQDPAVADPLEYALKAKRYIEEKMKA